MLVPRGIRPLSSTWSTPFDNAESCLTGYERHVVGHDRLRESLQGKRANLFRCDTSVECDVHALTDQNLTVLCLGTKTGSNIAHGPNRRVARAIGKPDLAERRITLCDTGTKSQIAATLAPGGYHLARGLPHRNRHPDGAFGRVGDGDWVIEKHHDAVARELIERTFELCDERPQGAVVLAQEIKNFLRLGSLGKCGEAAEVAEHDDDFAAMAFENFFIALRDYQLGQLRREKPLQSSDPSQFFDLLCDPCLKAAVQFRYFLGALPEFTEQPRVVHRNDGLLRETLQ